MDPRLLEAQSAKLSPAAIVEKVRETMGRLRAAAVAVPAARFAGGRRN